MFLQQTLKFESSCKEMCHKHCQICERVSLNLVTTSIFNQNICKNCLFINSDDVPFSLPVWIDENNNLRHDLPSELLDLRECEKLLIQQIAAVVPLLHLKIGQIGSRGHSCSFLQDIQEVCNILPRFPENIRMIRIIKTIKITGSSEIMTKAFRVRRLKVLNALKWLKRYNPEYKHIIIEEKNLDWMGEGILEKDLPITTTIIEIEEQDLNKSKEDLGPAPSQVSDMEKNKGEFQETYGIIPTAFNHIPKSKDNEVTSTIKDAIKGTEKVSLFYKNIYN